MSGALVEAEAFVLHHRPWRDTSSLIEAWALGHGRLGLVARGTGGSRGAERRALLQPWQPLRLSFRQRGELGQLVELDALSAPLRLVGERGLAGLYVNELLVRMLPRQEPHDALFPDYAALLATLESGEAMAPALRHFELDLLNELGWGIDLLHEADASAVREDAVYAWRPEEGLVTTDGPGVTGAALRALALRESWPAGQGDAVRRMLRQALLHCLGGKPLRAWSLADEVRRLKPVR